MKPESKPPSKSWHGLSNELWVTVWLPDMLRIRVSPQCKNLGNCIQTCTPENLKVTTDPFGALMEAGRNWTGSPVVNGFTPT